MLGTIQCIDVCTLMTCFTHGKGQPTLQSLPYDILYYYWYFLRLHADTKSCKEGFPNGNSGSRFDEWNQNQEDETDGPCFSDWPRCCHDVRENHSLIWCLSGFWRCGVVVVRPSGRTKLAQWDGSRNSAKTSSIHLPAALTASNPGFRNTLLKFIHQNGVSKKRAPSSWYYDFSRHLHLFRFFDAVNFTPCIEAIFEFWLVKG